DGVAVSCQEQGFLPMSQHAMLVYEDIAYHDYEGVALDLDERGRLIKDMGTKHLMILRNHGTLTVGKTCADAFLRLYYLERACTAEGYPRERRSPGPGADHDSKKFRQ